ncbi:hypothetical protein GZ77_19980 [Endozoicomonas montiporae]|uniref:S-adenosyl-L-homocysteine hydrolase NAD binding domain-containing protein n=2 Tax=Endozoicomonas montiporae TaxID=1027273 RepID=A0A081N2S3_9GAMM|nr:NAD(P)-dependent oxidoreductase [Endozoicomonas montiporae]AMO58013.1 S-adenosyl-L-homocysteine hydrolase [Endozoicomonas montiporae CL-33]KEQ12746.1 hypothetical protein GZ77_19980 [Endozoicomonas montiporae]
MSIQSEITQAIQSFYSPEEYPCLKDQIEVFAREQPFVGKSVLYAAPLTRNTQVALLPVVAGEADITLSWPDIVEPDKAVVALMKRLGIHFYQQVPSNQSFDLIFDCCGKYADYSASLGHIELTRSGLEKYLSQSNTVCLDVDSTVIKSIETTLGTGESLVRAMKHAGFTELAGKRILLFGYGKVGQGICRALLAEQANVDIVELQPGLSPEQSCFIDGSDQALVTEAVQKADFVITATGIKSVIENHYPVSEFINSSAKLINMGGEDEYGEAFPADTVLNGKHTFNFILDDPTLMKFIDPIFALYNECGKLLTQQSYSLGVHLPPDQTVMSVAGRFCQAHGIDMSEWV